MTDGITREQVLHHRASVQGLDRGGEAGAVLASGIQDSPPGPVPASLAARLPDPAGHAPRARRRGPGDARESLFRLGALPAGLVYAPGVTPLTFTRLDDGPGIPTSAADPGEPFAAFTVLTGPAGPAEAAALPGTAAARVREPPNALSEVELDGRALWFAGDARAFVRAERPTYVRLLPDRRRAVLWRNLSRRGAVFADGEITGFWQARRGAGGRLDVAVTGFDGAYDAAAPARIEGEAEPLAAARGFSSVRVSG